MPIITAADLTTHLYPEVISEITRADGTIADRAISAAITEAKMYLGRFDLTALFGTDSTEPAVNDEYLKAIVKDLACWHLIRLSNSGVDYAVFRTACQDAIGALKSIQAGQVQPGWPYVPAAAADLPDGDAISWCSNPKRQNYY